MITVEEQVQYLQKRFKLMQEQIDAVSSIASQAFDRATDALNATKANAKDLEKFARYGVDPPWQPPADAGEERD